jgi:hypothetical protein
MDLALHLGMTEAGLRKAMSARELSRWANRAERYGLPLRRIELLLAQIALVIAKTMGSAKDVTLDDFLFDPPPLDADFDEDGDVVMDAADLAAAFGAVLVRKD